MRLTLIFTSLLLCAGQAAAQAVAARPSVQAAASATRVAGKPAGVERLQGHDPMQRQKRALPDKPQPLASHGLDARPNAPTMGLCDGS